MSATQRLIDSAAAEVIRNNACSVVDSSLVADQAVALWTLLYRAADRSCCRISLGTAPAEVLRLFLEETLRAYEEMVGQPWRPAEPAPAEALETPQD